MAESFESGTLLGHVYTLRDGLPVRLRLARSSDAPAIHDLLDQRRDGGSELEPAQLVHFDPRRRYVLCATGLIDGAERLLGVGTIRLDGTTEPEWLVVAEESPPELTSLLRRALVGVAGALTARRAA